MPFLGKEGRRMEWKAKWICESRDAADVCPLYRKEFIIEKEVDQATLYVTAWGVYEAVLNGRRVGEFVLAPGWTSYETRLQYQAYDVKGLLARENKLEVTVGKGWYRSPMLGWEHSPVQQERMKKPAGLLAQLEIIYRDGSETMLVTDENWTWGESGVRFSEIYDGEIYDASMTLRADRPVRVLDVREQALIPQQGEEVREQEKIRPARIFTTPAGERVVDFGQEVTGYVEISLTANRGERVELSHGEVMDSKGNFYTANYREAKAKLKYICKEGRQSYKPKMTFFGFRYIRIDEFPGGTDQARPENFTAIAVHSQMRRTGYLRCAHPLLNRLFENIVWGQKGNFVDVPTDCPQRNERLGWTGDAQVFIRTACLHFDVKKFFIKWLDDMAADQQEDGQIGHIVPDIWKGKLSSAAWGDAAAICPWELYQAYGDLEALRRQFPMMKKWVDSIGKHTTTPYLWTGGEHYGDWLGLDAPSGSYKGSSREDFIASAFYAYSTKLVTWAGEALGEEVSAYRELYRNIEKAFRNAYPEYRTQTECVLALYFGLCEDPKKTEALLAEMIRACGGHLETGFVGTPYLLHVLSDQGDTKLAYDLLLREEYPSWLYPVTKGATTIWEHWDGIRQDGSFWSEDMNSFNHYAYGAVADWVYRVAAGITPLEPGYKRVRVAPHPEERLGELEAILHTEEGTIRSRWQKTEEGWRYDIETPVCAQIRIGEEEYEVPAGVYRYYSRLGGRND